MKLICKQCNTEIEITRTTIRDDEIVLQGYCCGKKKILYVERKE